MDNEKLVNTVKDWMEIDNQIKEYIEKIIPLLLLT